MGVVLLVFMTNMRPFSSLNRLKIGLLPQVVDDSHITWLAYKINIRSTILRDAKPNDFMNGFNMIVDSIENEDIFQSFFEISC